MLFNQNIANSSGPAFYRRYHSDTDNDNDDEQSDDNNEKDSDEEELRDVIDHDIITGKGFSKTSSPFASVNQSLKNVEERKEKRVNFAQEEPS